jgi:hypothetical protein
MLRCNYRRPRYCWLEPRSDTDQTQITYRSIYYQKVIGRSKPGVGGRAQPAAAGGGRAAAARVYVRTGLFRPTQQQ